nr:immunoglobulin heavy chain junction region [Mus musculus]
TVQEGWATMITTEATLTT